MTIKLLAGDARDVLPTLAADSVHCVVCSPPYWNLRDYGTALWDGGDAACDHANGRQGATRRDVSPERLAERAALYGTGTGAGSDVPPQQFRDTCGKCGAVRIDRQIGLEATPDAYLATMVAVFREVRRVLHPTGTVFCNMGDSYSDKQLLLMPARLALALQADGWWVRSDIIWHKPNPMPESCTDRPTSAHEHVFLLTKSARYWYDADAVREEAINEGRVVSYDGTQKNTGHENRTYPGCKPRDIVVSGRNLRNVWTIATSPFSAAHFATFPPELAERCIRAGTSERGCCAACGKPWRRIVERTFTPQTDVSLERGIKGADGQKPMDASNGWDGMPRGSTTATTTGWQPGCDHGAEVVPCRVLDPFAGASTTLLVAQRLQRDAIGIELNAEYVTMGRQRIEDEAGLFADVQTLDDAPTGVERETEALDCPDDRSAYPGLGDAQPSLWEWDRELAPT